MATPLPPDPYAALGVSRNADSATIKSAYRKLALKCHPDKVTDESQKPQKQEEFHKIQQAYELIGEEEKRAIYDAEVKLDQLRREKLSRTATNGPSVDIRTTGYGIRTQAPAGAAASMDARGPSRYDVPKSSSRYADDYYERSRTKYDTYDPFPTKHSTTTRTSRTEREKESRSSRTTDRTRSDEKKSRDKDERRDRSGKYAPFVHMEDESSSGDDKVRFEGGYRRRNEEEDARKKAAEARRKADADRTRSYEREPRKHRSSDDDDLRKHKISSQESDAMHHIGRTKYGEADRPSPSRTTSSSQYFVRKSDRPETVRRSSARTKDRPSSSRGESLRDLVKDRIPEIVEWGRHEDRKVPSMPHAKSSPAEIHVPRATPQRSHTTESVSRDARRRETSPTPAFRRSETMPHISSSSSRRKEATVPRPSGLRNGEIAGDSGYSSSSPPLPSYGAAPSTTTTKRFYYPTSGGGVSLLDDDVAVANGRRTIVREPDRIRATSPTPMSRPPMGPNRPAEASSQRSATANIPPPLGRSATTTSPIRGRAEEERGRPRKTLYGEIPARDPIRENRQPANYSPSPDRVAYTKKYGPEDIRWSGGRDHLAKDRDYDYARPSMQRSPTYAY